MFVLFFHHCFYDFFLTKCEHFDSYLLFIEYCDNDWHKSSGFKVNKYARTGSVVKRFTAQFRTIKMLFLSDRKFKSCKFHASTVNVFSSQNLPFELPQNFIS